MAGAEVDTATLGCIAISPMAVSDLKIDVGPGCRVYCTERNGELIVLLAGGDKSPQ